ncbi:MAG: DUF1385 domain-containing protein [Chloroflexota bacterium]|nr:DUF1385 domain-containing protein [Chloroflexota bacterium]
MPQKPESNKPVLGGQAVVEGIMIRGAHSVTIAVKNPSDSILVKSEELNNFFAGRLRSVPFIRGVIVLLETLVLGLRALTWSSAVATGDIEDEDQEAGLTFLDWVIFILAFGTGLAIFFVGPVVATSWLENFFPDWVAVLCEGVLRIFFLLVYIWLIGHLSDVERMFQFHGAEHMAIAAAEARTALTNQNVRNFSRLHPRCGTSFLLTVALVSVVIFTFAGSDPLWWRMLSRLMLIPAVASVAYEGIRLADKFQGFFLVKLISSGNLNLQKLTTRVPDDEHIDLAIVAVSRAQAFEDTVIEG